METTIVHRGYIGIVENKMETTIRILWGLGEEGNNDIGSMQGLCSLISY